MAQYFLIAAAVATLLTAFVHSYFGERLLIGPLVDSHAGVLVHALARQVLRFAWHLLSLLWTGQALLLLRAATTPSSFDRVAVCGLGVLYLLAGTFDAIFTRGKHIGWPLLMAIGFFSLLSLV